MVQHNRWTMTEIEGKVYRAKFIDHGWSYSDMKVQIRKRIKIIPNMIEFWMWSNIGSIKTSDLRNVITIDKKSYYDDTFTLNMIVRLIQSIDHKTKHSKVIGDGSRIDKINRILGHP